MSKSDRDKPSPQRSDVFVSYSRKDREFVRRLAEALEKRGREAWVDWQGIRPAEEFMQAIFPAIEGSDTFVFVISPDSVVSEVGLRELAHAATHNKRIVPIVVRDVSVADVPEALAKLNWVFCRETDGFDAAIDTLISALDTDLDWVRAHTRLLTRAIEWDAKSKSNSFVVRGEDLRTAEQWLAQAGTEKERQPTVLQTEYIIASRKAAARRQRITLGAVGFGAIVAAVLAILATVARNRAETERRNAQAATKRATLARDEGGKLIEFMTFDLRNKLQPIGRLDLLEDVNQRVRAFYDSFAGEDESLELLRQRSALFNNEGDVVRAQGNLAGALKSYRDALTIRERLARQNPGDAGWQRDLSISYDKVGDVQRALGDLDGALKSYRESLAIREKLVKQVPGNVDEESDLSASYDKVGNVQRAQGDLPGAIKSYRDSFNISEKLAKQEPGNAVWQQNLSVSYNKVGSVQSAQGDMAGALNSYRDSLVIREKLAKQDPRNADWQRELSISYDNVGDTQRPLGDLAGALKSHRDSLVIREKLAKQDPRNADWQRELSVSYDKIGNVQWEQEDFAGALQSYRDSLAIFEKLAKHDPANTGWQRDLSVSYGKVGNAQRAQGDLAGALESYTSSLAIVEKLAKQDPGNFQWQLDLAYDSRDVARVLLERSDVAEAKPHCERFRDIVDKLGEAAPTNYIVQTDRAKARAYLTACTDRKSAVGRADAVKLLKEAIKILQALQQQAELQPMHATWLRDYQRALEDLGTGGR